MDSAIVSHNYFKNRAEAGDFISEKLDKYRYDDTIVLCLTPGSLLVGAEVARRLHSLIALLMVKDIFLPDGQTLIGTINETGGFVYNNSFSAGEIEEFTQEYRGYIEQEKLRAMHELNIAIGQGGEISNDYFRYRTVIVVTDGAKNGTAFDMAYDFLKRISVKRIVMATPVASVEAVDKMHILADEITILNVVPIIEDLNHYYDENMIPDNTEIKPILDDIILSWSKEHLSI